MLSTHISVTFGACPSAPPWPGVAGMISNTPPRRVEIKQRKTIKSEFF